MHSHSGVFVALRVCLRVSKGLWLCIFQKPRRRSESPEHGALDHGEGGEKGGGTEEGQRTTEIEDTRALREAYVVFE